MLFSEIIKESYEPREYPALAQLSDEWLQTRPFWGCKVLVATPIFRNTLVEYRALMAGGANLYVGYSVGASGAAMPCDKKIVEFLKEIIIACRRLISFFCEEIDRGIGSLLGDDAFAVGIDAVKLPAKVEELPGKRVGFETVLGAE